MNRLTGRDGGTGGSAYYLRCFDDPCLGMMAEGPEHCEGCEHSYAACARLAAYEDTGLTPDEIATLRAENDGHKADIEAGRLVRLPAAIGQMVYVPSGDGGIYTAYVKEIGVIRPSAHDAVMRATVRVGLDNDVLEYLIAPENKGTRWFETEEAARAALGREDDP